jgi:L,D-peptidoglycan transpeptidase YkuD (ErfK/YbiS/YcfS/YnhG family)
MIPAPVHTATLPETTTCLISIANETYPCSIGRSGIKKNKQEGDGATPYGKYPIRKIYYRADRIAKNQLKTTLPVITIHPDDGWCDDINSIKYNQPVKLPFKGSYEALWRLDHVYDIVVVIGYNDQPIKKAQGSAIFLHVATDDYKPTAGCIAVSLPNLLKILSYLNANSVIEITGDKIKILYG